MGAIPASADILPDDQDKALTTCRSASPLYALQPHGERSKAQKVALDDRRLPRRRSAACVARLRRRDYKGKVVLLNFWASWCEPCKAESPAIERAWRKYGKDGLVVLGADVDDLSSAANKFILQNNLTYPILRYSSVNATKDFGTKRMPETFIIGRDGNVVALMRLQVDDAWLNEVIPKALGTGATGASGAGS
jgi:cytochrome c biogenesis protein CcmG/thiol:disulfide interchange protein DsbE